MLIKYRNVQVWILKTDGCVIFSRAYNNNIYRTILGEGDEEVAIGLCGYPSCFSILYHWCMSETRIESGLNQESLRTHSEGVANQSSTSCRAIEQVSGRMGRWSRVNHPAEFSSSFWICSSPLSYLAVKPTISPLG